MDARGIKGYLRKKELRSRSLHSGEHKGSSIAFGWRDSKRHRGVRGADGARAAGEDASSWQSYEPIGLHLRDAQPGKERRRSSCKKNRHRRRGGSAEVATAHRSQAVGRRSGQVTC